MCVKLSSEVVSSIPNGTTTGKTKEPLKDVREKILELYKAAWALKPSAVVIIHKWKNYTMTISRFRSIVRCLMRKVADQPKTTRDDLVSDLKAVGTTVTKNTIGNTRHRYRLKSCRFPCNTHNQFQGLTNHFSCGKK